MHGWKRKAATAAAASLAVAMAYGVVFGHNGLTVFAHKRAETVDLQRQMHCCRQKTIACEGRRASAE